MSEFVDNLTNAVRRVASNVTTGVSVAAQEQKVKDAYQTIGRLYYQAVQEGREPVGDEFAAQLNKIRELLASINEIRRNQQVTDWDFEDVT